MPNHVYSVIKFAYHSDNGEMIDKISKFISGDHKKLDFAKIIPQPEDIKHESEFILSDAEYDWNIKNWGTKWNAQEVVQTAKSTWSLVIRFKTAWSIPIPILDKLFELFPAVEINYVCADDGGWFACHVRKKPNEEPKTTDWTSENDKDGSIKLAMLEALNSQY